MEIDRASRALGAFASALATADKTHLLAERLCESACVALDADGASLTIDLTSGGRATVCATDTACERLEYLQDIVGEGPARDASRTGEIVVAPVGSDTFDRWPHLAVMVASAGLEGTYWAAPLRPAGTSIGVLTLHRSAGPLSADPATIGRVADAVGHAVLQDPQLNMADEDVAGLWTDRAIVHQATGMVVAQMAVTTTDALTVLRAHAFARNAALVDVAADVVAHRVRFTDIATSED